MIEITLTKRELNNTGLYLMRWKGRTGLVRIVGQPKTGWRILATKDDNKHEVLMKDLPATIPPDAMFSEPLALVAS